MKRKFLFIVFFVFLVMSVFSCTSFVYDGEVKVRGMNFDFSNDPDILLEFPADGSENAFYMAFNRYAVTFGINESGMFCTLQALSQYEQKEYEGQTMSLAEAFLHCIMDYDDVGEFQDYLLQQKLSIPPMMYVHMLCADTHSNAFITEIGEKGTEITQKPEDHDILAMTNFLAYKFDIYDGYKKVYGPGADRYERTYEYLLKKPEISTYEEAFQVLEVSKTSDTEFSVVFFPEEKLAYITFDGVFDRVWKLELETKLLTTEKGFDNQRTYDFKNGSINKSELIKW
ncbi:MAG: hypothetical protein ACOC34_06945 [Thermotogota bacterium]